MKENKIHNGWELDFSFPLGERTIKPRTSGITMIIDKGMGPWKQGIFLEMGAQH